MAERVSETGPENVKRNYAAHLTQGVSGSAANEPTSIGLVLPFLYTTIGAPIFFAGLLVPLNTLAKRISQIFTAQLVGTARSNTKIIALATLTMAVAIVLISLSVNALAPLWAVPVFLALAQPRLWPKRRDVALPTPAPNAPDRW